MKILDRFRIGFLNSLFRPKTEEAALNIRSNSVVYPNQQITSRGINFNVFIANGGLVIEVMHINQDLTSYPRLYVISNENEFGNEIAKIFTIEQLSKSN